MTFKVLTMHSQNTGAKCILAMRTQFEYTIMDQYEPENNYTPTKLTHQLS